MPSPGPRYAYATLITRPSYLAGVLLLAHSLQKHGSIYPLLVLYTTDMTEVAIRAIELEQRHSNIILHPVVHLLPPKGQNTTLIAARFADTWTKLRVFSEPSFEYDKLCYLDADMMIFNSNMDCVFDIVDLPAKDWLAATQICCCNRDKDPWAPEDWTPENCAYTGLKHLKALMQPNAVPRKGEGKRRHSELNGGLLVFHPSRGLWEQMLTFFDNCDHLGAFKFPDQDFLTEFFCGRWKSLPWRFNAIKTHRYWHPEMWSDRDVICLHYIVDKPWTRRVDEDGVAGFRGRDGETHRWWWKAYTQWEAERKQGGEEELLGIVGKYVASADGGDEDEDMLNIGAQAQKLAESCKPAAVAKVEKEIVNGAYRAIFDDKPRAERGHGPVVCELGRISASGLVR